MIGRQMDPRPALCRIEQVIAAFLATGVALALAFYSRSQCPHLPPLSREDLTAFGFDPYMVGYLFQGTVVQAALIFLASNTRVVRRALTGEARSGDARRLFALFSLLQLLVVAFDLIRPYLLGPGEPAQVMVGLLVVVTAGLLGGWRLGLRVGLVALFLRGTQQLVLMWPEIGPFLREETHMLYETAGWQGLVRYFPYRAILTDPYVYNLWASAAVWAGIVSGVYAELLGERRFHPLAAMALGVGVDLGTVYLTTVAGVPPGVLFLFPNLLLSGAAMPAVALMMRSVQAETARRKAEAAELALARAELRTLRAQINPHFLFNALNTIRYFVRTDPQTARRLLLDLSEVFQRALRSGELVPLRDELSYVQAYLALEQARLHERLRVEWSPAPETLCQTPLCDHPVPTLTLQPIVENAVVHGIARRPQGGTVRIHTAQVDGVLTIEVQDDGVGIPPERLAEVLSSERPSASIGLRNVDGRLRALYGEKHRLIIESEVGRGTRVVIRIPSER